MRTTHLKPNMFIPLLASLLFFGANTSTALPMDDNETQRVQLGYNMSQTAFYTLCWLQEAKLFPYSNGSGSVWNCYEPIKTYNKTIIDEESIFSFIASNAEKYFSEYQPQCYEHLYYVGYLPQYDKSDAWNDKQLDYPYKGYWHCILGVIRKLHGEKALEAIKVKTTKPARSWTDIIFERENEFRTYHGVGPLELDPKLSADAQAWAEKLSKDCKSSPSQKTEREKNTAELTGENVCESWTRTQPRVEDFALQCANNFYRENEDYPFPEGLDTVKEPKRSWKTVNRFTQTVWKGSAKVGYGYAENPDCGSDTPSKYLVSRYFPGGNVVGKYSENVIFPADYKPRTVFSEGLSERREKFEMGKKMFKSNFYTMCMYSDYQPFFTCVIGPYRLFMPNSTAIKDVNTLGVLINNYGELGFPQYHRKCASKLKDKNAPIPVDEGDANELGDDAIEYYFKGYWRCMLHALRAKFGEEVPLEIKERLITREDWKETMFRRINSIRARYGASPLKMDDKLHTEAQAHAAKVAEKCELKSKPKVNGGAEPPQQLSCVASPVDAAVAAYSCINEWYKQSQYYPFPEGYDKVKDSRPPGMYIDDFAQLVWSTTTHVGFGYVFNPVCQSKGGRPTTQYVVAKFSPMKGGNGTYNANVLSPKDPV